MKRSIEVPRSYQATPNRGNAQPGHAKLIAAVASTLLWTSGIVLAQATTAPSTTPPAISPADYADKLRAARNLEKRAQNTQKPADIQAAAKALESCATYHPEDVSLHTMLATLYGQLNDPKSALPHLQAVFAAQPNATGWGQLLVDAARKSGETDLQIATLQKIIPQLPGDAWSRVDLGNALLQKGDQAGATRSYESAYQIAPTEEWVGLPYAAALFKQKQFTQAQTVVQNVLKKHPDSQAAIALEHEISRLTPQDDFDVRFKAAQQLADTAEKTHAKTDYQAAATALQACSQLRPDDIGLHRQLGYIYLQRLAQPEAALPHLQAVYAAAPDSKGWGQMLSQAAGQVGRTDLQTKTLQDVTKRDPSNAWAWVDLGNVLAKQKQDDQADAAYANGVKQMPAEEWVVLPYAKFLYQHRLYSKAQSLTQQVLDKQPQSQPALALKKDIAQAIAAGDYDAKLKAAQSLAAKAEKSKSADDYKAAAAALQACSVIHPEDVSLHRQIGFIYQEKLNMPESALPHLQAVYQATPDAPGWGQLYARCAAEMNRPQLQIQTLYEVTQRAPNDPWSRIDLADALSKHERIDEAEKQYHDAYTIAPTEEWPGVVYARFYYARGRYADATRVLKTVLVDHPTSEAAKALMQQIAQAESQDAKKTRLAVTQPTGTYEQQLADAKSLEAQAYKTRSPDDFAAAVTALEACSALHPEDVDVHKSVGYMQLDKLHQPAEALPHLQAVYAATPDAPGWGQLLARAAGESGNTKLQIETLRDVTRRNPDDPWSRIDLADQLAKAGRPREAKAEYQQAIELAPHEEWVALPYAKFLYAQGNKSEARQTAEAVTVDHPESPTALSMLGDIDRDNFNFTRAKAEYNQARLTDPDFYAAKAGLEEIQKLKSPQFKSTFFLFDGSDHFFQAGSFNALTVPVSDHLFATLNTNVVWFNNDRTPLGTITRLEESVALQNRVNSQLSLDAGVTAFQVEGHDKFGFSVGATWKPTEDFFLYGSFRLNDPVNDSVFTAQDALRQNLLGLSTGYQLTKDIYLKANASHAWYSDGNGRNFLHAEATYMLYRPLQLQAGGEFEVLDYEDRNFAYPSPSNFETMGPLVEIQPQINKWLSLHARYEEVWNNSSFEWGEFVTAGLTIHVRDRLEASAEYLYVNYPGTDLNYSGNGFRVQLSYRF